MALTLDIIATIVADAKFELLIGEVEGKFIDVKRQLYNFADGLDGKREFAKDVAAFANAQGGYILIGLIAKKVPTKLGDEITEVCPILPGAFNSEQHIKILQEWLYPRPIGAEIKWVPCGPDASKGVAVILVPPQDERSKPFLITRTMYDNKSTTVTIAYVERKLDFTENHSVEELHHALRIGLNLERELLGRMDNLETLMKKHFGAAQQAESAVQASTRLQERVGRLLNEVGQ